MKKLILFILISFLFVTGCASNQHSLRHDIALSFDSERIAHDVAVKGKTTLIFIHGWSCDRRYRQKQLPVFAKKYRETTVEELIPCKLHCNEASEADGFVIVHPNWWGMPSAILKGWIDRIMRPGVAYEFLENDSDEGIPNGLLNAQKVIVFNTSNTETEREKTFS